MKQMISQFFILNFSLLTASIFGQMTPDDQYNWPEWFLFSYSEMVQRIALHVRIFYFYFDKKREKNILRIRPGICF